MNYVVVGKRLVDYFSKRKNAQVTGVELYVQSLDVIEKNGEGYFVLPPIYFNSSKHTFDDFVVNDIVNVYYDRFGNVTDVVKV